MAAAGTGWDAAAHRRECTIPPDQLKALNALPGWERTFQAAPLDETPDDSPASSQRGAREKSLAEEPEKTKAVASPGAHARRQRAPVLSFDDEDDEDDENDEDERALARADALVRAGRGDANPEMADPQTRGLRGVATADPPRAAGIDEIGTLALPPAMEREGLAMAFSPARTRGRSAAEKQKTKNVAPPKTAEMEDIMPTQAADPEAQREAARGAAAALASLFSPVGTRASRRRARRVGDDAPVSQPLTQLDLEAIAPTQAEPEADDGPQADDGTTPQAGGVFANVMNAVRGAVGLGAGAAGAGTTSPRVPESSARSDSAEPFVGRSARSPFAGRHRQKRRDDAREERARWESFAKEMDASTPKAKAKAKAKAPSKPEATKPSMELAAAAAVAGAVAAAAADGPTPPRRPASAFGDQGGDAPDPRRRGDGLSPAAETVGAATTRLDPTDRNPSTEGPKPFDPASSLVASRFSTGKKRKRTSDRMDLGPAPTASPAARVVPVEDAATTFGAAGAAPDAPAASPVDALLAARFSGKKKRRDDSVLNDGFEKPPTAARKGVDALVDVDGDGTGAPWYAGGTVEKKPKPAEKAPSKHKKKKTRATRAGTRQNERDRADRAEEEFAAVLAEMADDTEAYRADADAQRARSFAEAAAAKSAVARPPSSVKRAISFDEAKETALVEEKDLKDGGAAKKTPAADALALFGASARRFRGKRRLSASAPRRTPAAGVSAPKTKARDPRRSAMSLLGLGD